jgi:hypothetical protein
MLVCVCNMLVCVCNMLVCVCHMLVCVCNMLVCVCTSACALMAHLVPHVEVLLGQQASTVHTMAEQPRPHHHLRVPQPRV